MEKMWPFETDQRIPFLVRGPGVAPGTTLDVMGMNMDIAPTLLEAAGLPIPASVDGKSLLPLLVGSDAAKAAAAASWRTRTVISFAEGMDQWWGATTESTIGNPAGEPVPPNQTMNPPNASASGVRYSFDNPLNQWRSLRVRNTTHDASFVEWDPAFVFDTIASSALFDLRSDPYQVRRVMGGCGGMERTGGMASVQAAHLGVRAYVRASETVSGAAVRVTRVCLRVCRHWTLLRGLLCLRVCVRTHTRTHAHTHTRTHTHTRSHPPTHPPAHTHTHTHRHTHTHTHTHTHAHARRS
jgi:hypothetical protein